MSVSTNICDVLLDEFGAEFRAQWKELSSLRAARATGAESEKARLQLDNLRANSTTPERIIQGLEKNALTYLAVMKEHLHKAVHAAVKLEYANREIEATKRLIEIRARERAETNVSELYPETRRVVDELYMKHGISMGHFSTLEAGDVAAIADIIKGRFLQATGKPD